MGNVSSYSQDKLKVYLLPGDGSDYRIFNKFSLDSTKYDTVHIQYPIPKKHDTFNSYAATILEQVDTTEKFVLVGVSLGGMISTEMEKLSNPEKVILISAPENKNELPTRYNFMKYVHINKFFPGFVLKSFSFPAQTITEPDRKRESETFNKMLKDKKALFLRRTINMIINWGKTDKSEKVIQIHGDNDNTVPIKNLKPEYTLVGDSHMMALTEGEAISKLIESILSE